MNCHETLPCPHGVQGVASSNPAAPTNENNGLLILTSKPFLFLSLRVASVPHPCRKNRRLEGRAAWQADEFNPCKKILSGGDGGGRKPPCWRFSERTYTGRKIQSP